MTHRAKNILTFFIAGPAVLSVPVVVWFLLRLTLAKGITHDTADIVFQQFQVAIDQGATIRDRIAAEAVANQAYRSQNLGLLVDGWGRPMHIYAVIKGTHCQLNVQSAGRNGRFGDADDITMQQDFDLQPNKPK